VVYASSFVGLVRWREDAGPPRDFDEVANANPKEIEFDQAPSMRFFRRLRQSGNWSPARRAALGLVGLLVLLALFAARLVSTSYEKSFTPDEPHVVGTALYLWQSGDYHYARSLRFHPPLIFHLAALPLLPLDLDHLEPGPQLGSQLIQGPAPPPDLVRMLSRAPFVVLACWGAVLIFLWAREAAGPSAGLLAIFLYTFSPAILANGSLAHSDITVTVFYLQTLYAFWRWHRVPTPARLALCGLSLGLALLAKLSALLLLPMLGALLLATALGWRPLAGEQRPRGAAAVAARIAWAASRWTALLAIALGVVWLGYGGSFALAEGSSGPLEGRTLPGYLHALFFDFAANERGRAVFFFGQISEVGPWYVLPTAFALKTPLSVLGLLVLAIALPRRGRTGLGLFLGIPALIYALVACFWLRVPLGLRYVLPLYPLLHLYVATRLAPQRATAARVALAVGCAWLVVSSLWIHPHYLAYFNELLGGPRRAYRQLVESNLDWGQDLGTLADYLEKRGNPPVWLAYFGAEKPARYGLRAKRLRSCEPVSGLVAISATLLQGLHSPANPFRRAPEGCFDWLLEQEPVAQPGYSILVYEIADP
jgi:4-amino-4-deoxy-L-arabinose transferase-like glycosyltransferase